MPLERFTGPDVPGLLARVRARLGADAELVSMRRMADPALGFEVVAADPVTAATLRDRTRAEARRESAATYGPRRFVLGERPTAPARPAPTRESALRHSEHEPAPAAAASTPRPTRGFDPATSWPASVGPTPVIGGPADRRHREPTCIALVGPTGAGKTTTIAKLASHPQLFAGLRIGLLCLDTYRVGAVEQLRIYAEIARLPIEVVYEPKELKPAIKRLRDCDVLLIDTAGRGPAAAADTDATWKQLARLNPAEIHLVLPAGLRFEAMRTLVDRNMTHGATHLLATKCDEYPDDTAVFDLAASRGIPMRWCTDGQEVPFDLKAAGPRLVEARHPLLWGAEAGIA